MCHEEREAVFELLDRLGARPVDIATELTDLIPRLQGRPDTEAADRLALRTRAAAARIITPAPGPSGGTRSEADTWKRSPASS